VIGTVGFAMNPEGGVEIMSSDMNSGPVMRMMSFDVSPEQEPGIKCELRVSDEDDDQSRTSSVIRDGS